MYFAAEVPDSLPAGVDFASMRAIVERPSPGAGPGWGPE